MSIGFLFEKKVFYSIDELLNIMAILRSPKGCQWDMQQTHKSIRRDFLEECYEAIEAIDNEDTQLLKEELGDVLLQVIFHCRIEEESGSFNFSNVVSSLAEKLVQRHPHVFSETKVSGVEEILSNWDEIKRKTKGQENLAQVLNSVTPAMPALMRWQKIAKKAEKAGAELPINPVQRIHEISAKQLNKEDIAEILSLAVIQAEKLGVDAEELLATHTKKFVESFKST